MLLLGPVCSDKTFVRKRDYSKGYVLVNAAEIFRSLSRGGRHKFGTIFGEPLDLIGGFVAYRALKERRDVVTEMIGDHLEEVEASSTRRSRSATRSKSKPSSAVSTRRAAGSGGAGPTRSPPATRRPTTTAGSPRRRRGWRPSLKMIKPPRPPRKDPQHHPATMPDAYGPRQSGA